MLSMRGPRACALVAILSVTLPLTSGCLANMDEAKAALGFVDPPPPPPPEPLPPVATAEANLTLTTVGSALRFSGLASTDPDGTIVRHAWDFADGETAAGATVEHAFAEAGEFVVRLTVEDDAGLRATDDLTITVRAANRAPLAAIEVRDAAGREATSGDAGRALTFDATRSRDPDGEPVEVAWDFGDGATSLAPVVKHTFTTAGEYLVTLVVRDPAGATSRATRLVGQDANVTYPASEFEPTSAPNAVKREALRVPAGAASLEVVLRFDASYGVSDVDLAIEDATGERVARANLTTELGQRGEVVKSLALTSEILRGHAAGDWTIVLTKTKGFGVSYALAARVAF